MKSDKLLKPTRGWTGVRSIVPAAGVLILFAALSGCSSAPLAKHSVAFSAALAPVVDESAEIYRDAVAVHNQREGYDAVVAYQNKDATYNPRNAPVLMTDKDIQTRLATLAALQVYAQSLIDITKGPASADIDAASQSAGNSLTAVGNDLAPSIESVLGISAAPASTTETTVTTTSGGSTTTTSSSESAPALSSQVRNGISAGVNALAQFLVSRKVANELPPKIVQMDPNVEAVCEALAKDVQAINSIEQRDYDWILDKEKQFILEDEKPGTNANPELWRAEIMKLPEIARKQKAAKEKLTALHEALVNLAMTHHALAAEAQGNNPQALQEKLAELSDAGSKLGKFYSSLPAK
ncbi:MAG TPA: hypothetical protein VGR47_15165 [Terracidiphilus sp.]|nr:hypothetical protein [Terracidiphilus sp.]